VANYNAVVNLNVVGTSRLERVNAAVGQLNDLTRALNNNMNLLAPGAGKLGDKLRVAFEPIKKFARDASNGVAQFANTVAGASAQTQVFATVLDNVKLKSGGFDNQVADVRNLANAWAGAAINATDYNRRLKELQATTLAKQGMMMLSTGEVALGTEAGVGVQGPRLPRALGGGLNLPEGVSRLAPVGLRTAQGALTKPGVADAIIGAGFPALFGGGPGAILGGGVGGLAGGALGGPLGMALSVGLSAVGQKLDEATAKAAALGNALNELSVDKLRESFVYVNAELDTTVRRLLEAGEAQKAQKMIAEEAARQTGVLPQVTANITNEVNMLGNQWNKFLAAIGGSVSLLASAFIPALRTIVGGLTQILQFANSIASKIFEWVANGINKLLERFPFLNNLLGWFRGESEAVTEQQQQQIAQLAEATDRLRENVALAAELDRLKQSEVANGTLYGQLQNAEIEKEAQLATLRKEYDDKRREARVQYAGLALDAYEKELAKEEALRQKGIERTAEERARILVIKEADAQRALGLAQQNAQLDVQRNLIQQQLSLVQAYYQAQTTVNNIEIQSLERLRDSVSGLDTKLRITQKIYKLEVENAGIALKSAKAQIDATIQLSVLELQRAELKAKNLEIDLLSAAAQKETTSAQLANLRAAVEQGRAAVRIAADNLRFTQAIGKEQMRAAEATYQAALQAAKLKAQTAGAAAQAERFANAMASVGGARQLQVGDVVARASDIPQGPDYAFKPVQGGYEVTRVPAQGAFAAGGYVTKRTRALLGEAGEPEFVVPQSKVGGFIENWLKGKRGSAAVPYARDRAEVGPINIQTGPVMRYDNQDFIKVGDMQAAMERMAAALYNSHRSAGIRRYVGIR